MQLSDRLAVSPSVRAHQATLDLLDAVNGNSATATSRAMVFRWVWVVFIGIVIVAAAVAFVYCRSRGYHGFSGHLEALKGPFGVRIGTKLGCY
jgi:hypothetical protein